MQQTSSTTPQAAPASPATSQALPLLMQQALDLLETGATAAALARALAILAQDAQHVEALHIAAIVHLSVGDASQAQQRLLAVVAQQPTNAHAHWRLALACQALGQYHQAVIGFDNAMQLNLVEPALPKQRFMAACQALEDAMHHSDWSPLARLQRVVREGVLDGFWLSGEVALAAPELGDLVAYQAARNHARDVMASLPPCPDLSSMALQRQGEPATLQASPILPTRASPDLRLRIGFVGDDFHEQATAYLMVGFIEALDRTRFAVTAYDTGAPVAPTAFRQRVMRAYENFVDISALPDTVAVQRIKADGIDILVSIKSPGVARLGIFARRPAAIQMHYLYYPATSGMPFFDYIIADATVIPAVADSAYTEAVLRLPGCYQPNDSTRPLARNSVAATWQLPESAVVMANFSQTYKITPAMFDLWCLLLQREPDRILWLLSDDPMVHERLRQQAIRRGIDPQRLHFAAKAPLQTHLDRLRHADLIVDTFPYGGHTLTSDALWAGTPVLTLCGASFASRVAASLLTDVGLPELIATTELDYLACAEALLCDASRRGRLRNHLDDNRRHFALFDAAGYARKFGAAMLSLSNRRPAG